MKEQIKSMPWDVKVAIVFLLGIYVLMCVMAPIIWLSLTAGIGTILSIARVVHYLQYGD